MKSKGLRSETLDAAGVIHDGDRLYFGYRLPGEHTDIQTRYIDLRAWERGDQDKWWSPGSTAKGAYWPAMHAFHRVPELEHTLPRRVLVCEGETDALAAVQHCIDHPSDYPFSFIIAVPGAHTVGRELIDKLLEWGYEIVVAFDRDEAGDAGAQKIAWHVAERAPITRLVFPNSENDLREVVLSNDFYRYEREVLEQQPRIEPHKPIPSRHSSRSKIGRNQLDPDLKPDLQRVWDVLVPRSKRLRKDGQGRALRQAWCPIHDDGEKPGAWVGEDRWGCFVCGIESADVYELVAWVRGYAQPGDSLHGDTFTKAREEARSLAP